MEKNTDKLTEDKKYFIPYTELTYFGYKVLLVGEVTYFISNLTTFLKSINARIIWGSHSNAADDQSLSFDTVSLGEQFLTLQRTKMPSTSGSSSLSSWTAWHLRDKRQHHP